MWYVSEQAIKDTIGEAAQGSWIEQTARLWYLMHNKQVTLSVVDAGHGLYEFGVWHSGEHPSHLIWPMTSDRVNAAELANVLKLNLTKPTNPLERRIADAIKLPAS
ncbi:MAG: hypothetical protein HY438_00560 [DPANN group archaeon]|nr:hypothetical protein [DPANN group archaeon]